MSGGLGEAPQLPEESRIYVFFGFIVFFGFLEVFLVFSIFAGLSILLPGLFSHWFCVCDGARVYQKWTKSQTPRHTKICLQFIFYISTTYFFMTFFLLFCCMHMVWTEHVSLQKDGHRLHCLVRLLCCASGPGTT